MISLDLKKLRSKTRKQALNSNERVAKRTVEILEKRNKCSVYNINQKVLVRYGKKGTKMPKNRHVCFGKIERVVNMTCTKLILEI